MTTTQMLATTLMGGLGNQLFQVAAVDTIANETGRTVCIIEPVSPKTVHTDANYFESVLSEWANAPRLPTPHRLVGESSFVKQDWSATFPPDEPVCLQGYFQNWTYISPDFPSRLRLPECHPLEGAFLHIRGGDYVNHWFHDVGLTRGYYDRAIAEFPVGTHFYVFTNDIPYARQCPVLQSIPHTILESDERTALSQMASCILGGICANSSFSWWGAYLNRNRTLVMPDKWFTDARMHTEGYYFPGVKKCRV